MLLFLLAVEVVKSDIEGHYRSRLLQVASESSSQVLVNNMFIGAVSSICLIIICNHLFRIDM
jgi:hypothetical protein